MRSTLFATMILCLVIGCSGDTKQNEENATSAAPAKTSQVALEQPVSAATAEAGTADAPAKQEAEGTWGHLTGKIVVAGDLPEIPAEAMDAACLELVDGEAPKDDKLVVDADGGLRDVFVMMYLKNVDGEIPVHPSYEALMAEPVVIDNINCRFEPHAVFCRTGQVLRMKNSDKVGHNCHVNAFNNEKNVNIPANNHVDWEAEKVVEKSPGPVVCDIHIGWMDAKILFRDEPYVAISKTDGTFTIENIPAGEWEFQFWHEKGANLKKLQIEGYDVGRRGETTVTITDGETLDLGTMTIDAEALNR